MSLKHSLCAAALAVPFLAFAAGPSAAHSDVEFGLGFGSPYYGMYPYGPYYDPYDDFYYERGLAVGVDVDDVDVEVVAPAAAEPAPCVKTNVRNLRNACPF
jgi:hypothetical protein